MMRNSLIALLLIGDLLFFGVASAWGTTTPAFKDIKGSFAEQSIHSLAEQGMIHGISADQFGPSLKISRLQFAVLIAKVLGVQPLLPASDTFVDLAPGTIESGYVEALTRLGIVHGTGSQTFQGSAPIRRQDVAVILKRALDQGQTSVSTVSYKDTAAISSYAVEGVAFVTAQGLMRGSSDGRFFPAYNMTREEAAVLMDGLLNLRGEQALANNPVEEVLELRSGESISIGSNQAASPAAFTEVYGIDSPSISISAPGSSQLRGGTAGTATLTRNFGGNAYPVTIKVAAAGSSQEPAGNVDLTELPLSYKVLEHVPDNSFKQTEYKNYSGPVDGLTSKSETWTGFFRQQGRDIIIDLGSLQSVANISMEFRQDVGSGISFPQYMAGAVSADGASWYRLGQVYHSIAPGDKLVQDRTLSLVFPSVTTRYIKLTLPVDVFVFARHLSVKGGLPAVPVVLAPIIGQTQPQDGYMRTTAFKDILLVFTGDQTEIKTLNSEQFLPLVAYQSPEGTVNGRMFDTIQFMPYTGIPCTKTSWAAYLEDLFKPGQQLDALEDAVIKSGMTEKQKVILTLPYPEVNQSDFGSLDGNGESLSFVPGQDSTKNRLAAVQWYYNELMRRWNGAGFKHLELAGIYWYKEMMDPKINGEIELVQSVAQLVRNNEDNFIWIPYFGNRGLAEWRTYGFTHVFLQPNYYATQDPPEDRMDQAAALARQYNIGIELEFDNRVLTSRYYYDLFYKELNKAHEHGLDGDTPNAYYAGFAKTLLDMVKSEIPQIRQIYDDLYLWINGKFK